MSKFVVVISTLGGFAAVFVVYVTFVAHEFVKSGRLGRAMGLGVFPYVAMRPEFLIVAGLAFAMAFYKVAH